MQAGFYQADITPPLGTEMPATYYKCYSSKIHDQLYARAAVFDDGQQKVALVGLDSAGGPAPQIMAEIRRKVEQQCGIPGTHVLLAASHTHSGGALANFALEIPDDAPELIRCLAHEHSIMADPLYVQWCTRQIITAICEADRRREEALLSVGSGHEDQVAYNRRFVMKNGRCFTHPGKGNPDIVKPAGPIDPEVGVLAAWTPQGRLLGCVVNYACHGTTLNGLGSSADWIHYLDRTIRAVMGREAVVVFLNGASGDITQVNNQSLTPFESGERWAQLVGLRVGAEALKVIVTAEKGALTPIQALSRGLKIARRVPAPERVARCRALVEAGLQAFRSGQKKQSSLYSTDWLFAKEIVILDYAVKTSPAADVEVQAIQIGPVIFLANPAEFFCELGLRIKQGSTFPFTYVVSLANSALGYVPTAEAFLPSGGGYETVLNSYSNLEPEAGNRIVAASLELAGKLKPGRVPALPPLPKPLGPWPYGVLGPDLE